MAAGGIQGCCRSRARYRWPVSGLSTRRNAQSCWPGGRGGWGMAARSIQVICALRGNGLISVSARLPNSERSRSGWKGRENAHQLAPAAPAGAGARVLGYSHSGGLMLAPPLRRAVQKAATWPPGTSQAPRRQRGNWSCGGARGCDTLEPPRAGARWARRGRGAGFGEMQSLSVEEGTLVTDSGENMPRIPARLCGGSELFANDLLCAAANSHKRITALCNLRKLCE